MIVTEQWALSTERARRVGCGSVASVVWSQAAIAGMTGRREVVAR